MRNDHDKTNAGGADATKKAADDILREMNAREKAQSAEEDNSTLFDKVRDMHLAATRINKAWGAAHKLWQAVQPVARAIAAPAFWVAGELKDIFVWNAFEHDAKGLKLDAEGDPVFSPGRLMRAFATAAILTNMAFVGGAGVAFHLTKDTVYSYVTNKQMKIPGELYEVTGAESLPTSTQLDNGMYYHVTDSTFYPMQWRPEEDVYALIPQGDAVCKWEVHGVYSKEFKWLHKQIEFYQDIYETTCYPLSEAMIGTIVREGILPHDMFNRLADNPAQFAPVTSHEQAAQAVAPASINMPQLELVR